MPVSEFRLRYAVLQVLLLLYSFIHYFLHKITLRYLKKVLCDDIPDRLLSGVKYVNTVKLSEGFMYCQRFLVPVISNLSTPRSNNEILAIFAKKAVP